MGGLNIRTSEDLDKLLSEIDNKSKFVREAIFAYYHNQQTDPRISKFLYVQSGSTPGIKFKNHYFMRFNQEEIIDFELFLTNCKDYFNSLKNKKYEVDPPTKEEATKYANFFNELYFDNYS